MNFVVVDDESSALSTFFSHCIDQIDFHYQMFQNEPMSVLDYLSNHEVDVAFLDIQMPKINGVELARRILQACPQIKIVFITGFTYDEKALKEEFQDALLGFCYKPFEKEQFFQLVSQIPTNKRNIKIQMFGNFVLYIQGHPVLFSSSKSRELFAFLVHKKGAMVSMDEIIGNLWPEHDIEKAKALYRDAIWRLRLVSQEYHFSDILNISRGRARVILTNVEVDLFEFLQGKKELFFGEYLRGYDWSISRELYLEELVKKQ